MPCLMRFCAADLRLVRRVTAQWAARAGLSAERVVDFVIAVSEIATNAIRYGSPTALLALRAKEDSAVLAEVSDSGLWELGTGPADAEGRGRMGLALAHRVCDEVDIRTGRSGTTVVLRMSVAA